MDDDPRKRRRILPQPEGFLPSRKPQQRVHAPRFQSAFTASTISSSVGTRKPPTCPLRPPQLPQRSNIPMVQGTRQTSEPMRRQPIPALPSPLELQPPKTTNPMKRLEPPSIPINQKSSRPPTAVKPILSTDIFMKDPPAPVVPAKQLQKRALPIPDLPVSADTREMKPLSSTHFATLTDIPFDDDSVDLSSILLQLQEHRAATELGQHHKPDTLTSPQKNKHIRGGLAARAAHLFKKSHTSLYLWRTALEGQSAQQTSPDISFRVGKVVHTVTTGSCKPCLSITLSRVLVPVRPFTSRKQHVYILLRFPDASKFSSICNPSILKEGATLRIWRPWHEVVLADSVVEAPTASLPLPSSIDSAGMTLDDNIHHTVILCSRFSLIQET